jgi:transcription antitermination factor NusA-like protein
MSVYIYFPVGLGVGLLGGFLILFWILNNPEKAERIFYWLLRLFSLIPMGRRHILHLRLATSLQTTINPTLQSINSSAFRVLPYPMKIEWAKKGQDAQTFLRDGQVIVTMHPNVDNDHNIAVSTVAYLKKGLLPQARHYVDPTLMQATDYTVAKQIFKLAKHDSASEYLIQNLLLPQAKNNPQLTNDSAALDTMNNAGLFSPVFLVQLHSLGKRLFPVTPDKRVAQEIRNFLEFLQDIALKKSGETVDLDFARSNIRVKVMIVAREETKQRGTQDFVRRIKQAQSDGLDYIYISAWGIDNITLAQEIANTQQETGRLVILAKYPYQRLFAHGKSSPAIFIVTALNIMIGELETLDRPGTLYPLLEEHIDELRDGKVKVTALVRKPGILSKVIVKPCIDGLDPVECFKKKLGKGSLQLALGQEKLHVIPWSDNTEDLISSSLLPQGTHDVSDILLNPTTKTASLKIQPRKLSKAIGHDGLNVQLASKLTGWRIKITPADEGQGMPIDSTPNKDKLA